MARVTVEDCVTKIPNRFELVLTAAQRAKAIGVGAELTLDRDNDKNSVVSLREIADETIPLEELKDNVIKSFQKVTFMDDDEDEESIDLMEGENDWSGLSDFGNDAEKADGDDANMIGYSVTDAQTEEAENNEYMVGQAIDPSTIPDSLK